MAASRTGLSPIEPGAALGIAAIEQRGHSVTVVAPSVDASRGVLRKEGFAGADTLQKLLGDSALQSKCRHGVIWCDEAGVVGTQDMLQLLKLVQQLNAKLVLSGDSRQHKSVPRGDAMRIIEEHGGLKIVRVEEIMRQKGRFKDAIKAISKGLFDTGFAILDQLGFIKEVSDAGRQADITMDYLDGVRRGKSTLVVAPTHLEGEQLTELIRAGLKRDGKLSQEDRLVMRHRDLSWTTPQKKDAALYQDGQVIRFQRRVEGFRLNEAYRVIGRDERGNIQIQSDRSSRKQILPLAKAGAFGVFLEKPVRLAAGERIRITRNGTTKDGKHRLNSGSFYRIEGFTKRGHIQLDNGWTIDAGFGHFTHGYTTTSHAAQGQTCDRVLISQPASTLGAASPEQVYVSLSRGRHEAVWYTDNRKTLIDSISRLGIRRSAIELMDQSAGQRHRQHVYEQAGVVQRVRQYEKSRQKAGQSKGRSLLEVLRGR